MSFYTDEQLSMILSTFDCTMTADDSRPNINNLWDDWDVNDRVYEETTWNYVRNMQEWLEGICPLTDALNATQLLHILEKMELA